NDILRPLSLWIPTLRARLLELAEEANLTAFAMNTTYEYGLHTQLRYVWASALYFREHPHSQEWQGYLGGWVEVSGISIFRDFGRFPTIKGHGQVIESAGVGISTTTAWTLIGNVENATVALRATRLALPPIAAERAVLVDAGAVALGATTNATNTAENIGHWEVYDDTYQVHRRLDSMYMGWTRYGDFDAQS
ncbi:MAG: hypothetical protein GWN18_06190, partial [Thermoplasmata archaeon]|nr:hypothetical protein [Thermoplasmata archaeon]NIV28250.1 hypothetical protein [Anaerolineae bacterium]NIS11661.1 hypothetical protein [Thermoplasmata archaeon]NIS19559.1 hypothetical protein [Thermoplasmata archaeon]NIT76711.1 hypothetical protein [Thermoplasmata archaeon]